MKDKPNFTVLNVAEIRGQQYAIVDVGPAYVNGMFAKFIIVPVSSIAGPVDNDIRVYDEDTKV